MVVATGSSLIIGHYFGAFLGNGVVKSAEKITNYAIVICKKHVSYVVDMIVKAIPVSVKRPILQMDSFIGIESLEDMIATVLYIECMLFFFYILMWCCCGRKRY